MKILVMGAGAIGSYLGGRLQQAGEQVIFCARSEYLRALKEKGLEIRSISGDAQMEVVVTDRPQDHAPYDLILLCVKSYDTARAAESVRGCLKPGAAILTVQNGVENEAMLCDVLGRESVMGGIARLGAEMVAPGKVVHTSNGWIDFGELDGSVSPRARAYAEVFRRAGVLGEFTTQLKTTRWEKLLGNCSFNTVSALTRSRIGDYIDDDEVLELLRRLMREALSVARAEGATIEESHIEQIIAHAREKLRRNRPSTLQDLERGRRLEYDAITGAVVRAARRHGIDVPVTNAVHALLKVLDASRARARDTTAT